MARDDELVTKIYESARAEIIQRIALRDQALMAYVAIIGGYLFFLVSRFKDGGFEIKDNVCTEFTLSFPLPIICLLFTFIVIQHHLVISDLGRFLKNEWPKNLGRTKVLHWDDSNSLRDRAEFIQLIRTLAQCVSLLVPLGFEVIMYSKNFSTLQSQCCVLLTLSALLFVTSAALIVGIHVWAHFQRTAAIRTSEQK